MEEQGLQYRIVEPIGDRTLAVAESVTGGALAARIVSVPGASRYFLGGVVAYSNDLKRSALGVSDDLLREHGAVSEECALAMARGARRFAGADIALATTGIAGPEGGTESKPVGLVYVALVAPDAELCTRSVWPEGRHECVGNTVEEGLRLLYKYLTSRS